MPVIHFKTKPPVWDVVKAATGVNWVSGVYCTYGGEIYCHDDHLPEEFLVHELVHVAQQRHMDKDEYVGKYIKSSEFRKEVEAEAYRVHDEYLRAAIKDENELFTKLYRNRKAFARIVPCSIEEADQILSAYTAQRLLP